MKSLGNNKINTIQANTLKDLTCSFQSALP
jgi:hypothetical protein